jgi:hypothetical protein
MRRFAFIAAVGAILIGGGAASSDQGAVVTALVGDASTPGRSLAGQDALASEGVITVTDTEEFRRDFQGDPVNPPAPDPDPDPQIPDPPIPGEHL